MLSKIAMPNIIRSPTLIFVLAALLLAHLSGCTTQYVSSVSHKSLQDIRLKSRFTVDRVADWRLAASTSISLAEPVDLSKSRRHRNLFKLNESLYQQLYQAFPNLTQLAKSESLEQTFIKAQERGSQLLFLPRLVEVENNLNSKIELLEGRSLHPSANRRPDSIIFQVLIYDVRTRQLLDNARVLGRGRMFAPSHVGPQELYAQATERYVSSIASLGSH